MTSKKNTTSSSNQSESDFAQLARPAQRALEAAGIQSLEQLTKLSEAEIKRLHGMGPNALGKLRQALSDRGLSFSKEMDGKE